MAKSKYFIHGNRLIAIHQTISESHELFDKRIVFYAKALMLNLEDDIIVALSNAYSNKLKYNVMYIQAVEDEISRVIQLCDRFKIKFN